MDTLQTKISSIVSTNQDTLLTKVLLYSKEIPEHSSDNVFLPYLPILSVVAGAFLAFITQYCIKLFELSQQKKREISLTKYNLIKNINLLHFYLRDLAYLKVDTSLQNHYAATETDEYAQKKAQDEAYSNYKHIADKEEKISLLYSELYSDIIKYFKLTKNLIPTDTSTKFEDLRDSLLNLDKASEISDRSYDIEAFIESEIRRLTDTYIKKLINIKTIIHRLE